ncbi:MAG: DUF4190 domain-containing protein [Puniceicoccales bacterium]|jgi:hypothetical protein|nr:DUF4190 domain-containing protein [Puniceicoccales bacterium]
MEYYYVSAANKAEGPVSLEQLQALLSAGQVNASTKVAAVGSQEWVPITNVLPGSSFPIGTPASPVPSSSAPGQPPVIVMTGNGGGNDPLAIVSMVLSIVGCCMCCYGFPLYIAGIVCGHISLYRIKQNPLLQGRGMAIAGLCIGYIAIVVWTALIIIGIATGAAEEFRRSR